jgi:serine/threonine protein kinase
MSSRSVAKVEAIAKGGVGCVVTPALQCIGAKQTDSANGKMVSKVFTDKEEYQKELRISQKLQEKLTAVENANDYFIYKTAECELTPTQLQRLKSASVIETCSDLSIEPAVYVLNYPMGGKSIESILKTATNKYIINNVLLNLEHLFEGVQLLNDHLIYHLDLSIGNVLFADDGKMKNIDFGRCFIAESEGEFTQEKFTEHYKTTGFPRPKYMAPELFSTIRGGEYMVGLKDFQNVLYKKRGIDMGWVQECRKNNASFKDRIAKADVWALGVILYEIRTKLKLSKNESLNNLIDLLTNADVAKRPDCHRALKLYQEFVESYRTLQAFPTPSPTPSPTGSPRSVEEEVGGSYIKRRTNRKKRVTIKKRSTKKRTYKKQ